MHLLGTIVALQIQVSSLKVGVQTRQYDPSALLGATALRLDNGGVASCNTDGVCLLDVHHREHPASKYRGENGISIGFTAHYAAMRARFGPHLVDGIAGENILVQTDRKIALSDLEHGLIVACNGVPLLRLEAVVIAEPCLPFSRFALGSADNDRSDQAVKSALLFLRQGCRGFYVGYRGALTIIRVEDQILFP